MTPVAVGAPLLPEFQRVGRSKRSSQRSSQPFFLLCSRRPIAAGVLIGREERYLEHKFGDACAVSRLITRFVVSFHQPIRMRGHREEG